MINYNKKMKNRKYIVTKDDFIRLENQRKVTVQELENLKTRINEMFKQFTENYNEIKK